MQYKVGDIIVSASGSSYVGEIIYISKEEDVVRHRCRKTGTEYEKSYFGFQCRYMSVEERLKKDKEFCTENIQLHQQMIKLEQERDEARAEVERLRAEVEMLRGVGCREAKEGEPESGPCGVCLKWAEERGARWALERHGNPFATKTLAQYAEDICRDARGKQ